MALMVSAAPVEGGGGCEGGLVVGVLLSNLDWSCARDSTFDEATRQADNSSILEDVSCNFC